MEQIKLTQGELLWTLERALDVLAGVLEGTESTEEAGEFLKLARGNVREAKKP